MSLNRLEIEIDPVDPPHFIQVLLDETADAIQDWQGDHSPRQFVPADYLYVYEALCALRPLLPSQPGFCEWGSGFGIVTLLAAARGMRATGIEIQPALVEESRGIARGFGIRARFRLGSFFPEDTDALENIEELLGKADLTYVYPWPDQEIEIFDLFDRLGKPGSLLLTYHGIEDIRLFRKS